MQLANDRAAPAIAAPVRLLRHLAPGRVLPRRTVRLRLTALYGALFLLSGVALLAITNSLARGWPWPRSGGPFKGTGDTSAPGTGGRTSSSPAAALTSRIQQVQTQEAAQRSAELHQLLAGSAVALGIMVVVSVALGWFVAGRMLRPLREMATATRRISEDSLDERLAMPGPGDELKDLGDTIDGLVERLEAAFAAQRRFVANASHELRTPLATMRASLDVAMAKPGPVPAQTVALAGRLRAELDQVDRLLEGFLVLARAQHGALPDRTMVSLGRLASTALADRADAVAAGGLTVNDADCRDGAWVAGSQTLLCRMVGNVIDNAIGHNQGGGWIRIRTEADGALARLVVETGGDVLDQRQVEQLAQPFRRLGADRTGSGNGAGLGLSIVAAIAAAHGGTLDLQARAEGGLRVGIGLPLAAAAPAGVAA
jgi:signal transduction histidine kinase